MISEHVVDLSRLQFAATAMYHFLFVPLTLGMVWLLVIMETVYVMTGKTVWKDMTRFWGKLFGINFALGVTTGITLEFQFGTNWAYYSHYVGDIFGAPLAIEGLMPDFVQQQPWFAGYSGGVVAVSWFGYDQPRSLGRNETGAQVALHETRIFIEALFAVPGLRLESEPRLVWNRPMMSYEVRDTVVGCPIRLEQTTENLTRSW